MAFKLLLSTLLLSCASAGHLNNYFSGAPAMYSFTTNFGRGNPGLHSHGANPYFTAPAGGHYQQQQQPLAPLVVEEAPIVEAPYHHVEEVAPLAYNHVEEVVAPLAYNHVEEVVAPVQHHHLAPPVITSSQYHAQDELGSVEYGYNNINSAKKESRDHYGNVQGAYSYVDATGFPKTVEYVADDFGFRVIGANNLPVAPLDTPEVAHARAAHHYALSQTY